MAVSKELFGEGKHVEFKSEIPKKHEKFLKDIIAFANTSGGKIMVGIEDETGEVIGLGDQSPFKLSDAISNMVSDAITPQIDMEITPKTVEGETVLEVEVFHDRHCPYYLKSAGKEKSSYIRVNGTSRPADARKLRELELEGEQISYDTMREIGEAFDEADANALMERMYQAALAACRDEAERNDVHPLTLGKLEDFGILCKDGKEYVPTHAYTLLTKPRERYVKIQCALFKGTERDEFIDKKEFPGPIQDQVEDAYQFVLKHINRSAVIEGLYRHDRYELPTKSIREVIANAALHRSYLDSSAIQVSIFDDRLEVSSPGMLYDGLNRAEALSGKSKCRNKAIAEAFQYMKIIEGWGTGLPRLFRQCKEMGLPEPKFEEFGDGIKVTIYRANGANPSSTDGTNETNPVANEANRSNDEANEAKDESIQARILAVIKYDPTISQRTLAEKIGVARSTVQRHMAQMEESGLLKRRGGTRGSWEIQEKN